MSDAPGAKPLAGVRSRPLAEMVGLVNRDSDNFVAEMLLKELAARTGRQGTTGRGAHVVVSVLADGSPVAQRSARAGQDRFVTVLASD